jgi:hypothetical protein
MNFKLNVKTDGIYSSELTINVGDDPNASFNTLLPAKARLVAKALLQAADAAETTGGAQDAIDALLASADPGKIVVPAIDAREYTEDSDLPM